MVSKAEAQEGRLLLRVLRLEAARREAENQGLFVDACEAEDLLCKALDDLDGFYDAEGFDVEREARKPLSQCAERLLRDLGMKA